ncbi:hypothetical protein BJF78_29390 [Pseudonocardia sp. CNS-139]|nr:hypothetical protein BJF78_29390 [Pseudonocardia sp. CNS-139]
MGDAPVPVGLSLLAVAVAVLVLLDVRSPVRVAFVLVFVLTAPGWALLDWQGLARGWLGAALAVATSVSLATVVATAQLYAGVWSPTATVLVLALVTVAASALSLRRRGGPR